MNDGFLLLKICEKSKKNRLRLAKKNTYFQHLRTFKTPKFSPGRAQNTSFKCFLCIQIIFFLTKTFHFFRYCAQLIFIVLFEQKRALLLSDKTIHRALDNISIYPFCEQKRVPLSFVKMFHRLRERTSIMFSFCEQQKASLLFMKTLNKLCGAAGAH